MADNKQAAQMPQPTDQHRRLHALAGEWEGDETIAPSPWGPGGPARGRSTISVAVDGFFLVQDYVEEKAGRTVFRGHGIFGWDAESKTYVWYWVDSMGQPPAAPSRGRWEGDTLIFESSSPRGKGRYTYQFDGADGYRFKIENSFDGGKGWATLIEAAYHRR